MVFELFRSSSRRSACPCHGLPIVEIPGVVANHDLSPLGLGDFTEERFHGLLKFLFLKILVTDNAVVIEDE